MTTLLSTPVRGLVRREAHQAMAQPRYFGDSDDFETGVAQASLGSSFACEELQAARSLSPSAARRVNSDQYRPTRRHCSAVSNILYSYPQADDRWPLTLDQRYASEG